MSNFYGGKQGFSFFIAKTYILEQLLNGKYKETIDADNDEGLTIDSFLEKKFNEDLDVHYNDYILLSVGVAGFNFTATDNYHGNLYRKDITEFKLVGNLAGPPGGASQVIPVDWNNFENEYEADKNKDSFIPVNKGETLISANVVDGGEKDTETGKFKYNKILFKYYSYRNEDKTTTLKLAIQIPAPYIDFSEFYFPEKTNVAPKIERITPTENKNLFYNEYRYPLVTKYYQPRIENDELYGDLYSYKQNSDNNNYSYQSDGETIYLGKIKQESGILIGANIAYYILTSESGDQTDTALQTYLDSVEKRSALKKAPEEGYTLLINKKVICKKLNDDYPCGLGYEYKSNEDHSSRVVSNVDLVGKIVTYGDESGPIADNLKVTNWFFAYNFSREKDKQTGNIIPDWYFLSLYSTETKIIFATDNESGTGPASAEDLKQGDLWIGLEDNTFEGGL